MKRKEAVTIGTELKKILDQTGMSSYRLSQELGIGQSYLSRLFNNKFNPSYGLVKKVAEMLGCDLRLVKTQNRRSKGRNPTEDREIKKVLKMKSGP